MPRYTPIAVPSTYTASLTNPSSCTFEHPDPRSEFTPFLRHTTRDVTSYICHYCPLRMRHQSENPTISVSNTCNSLRASIWVERISGGDPPSIIGVSYWY